MAPQKKDNRCQCSDPNCKRQKAKGRKLSYTCYSRKYRDTHPKRYTYNALKQNAKRRGKEFDLTFEQFCQFATQTNYMKGKGKSATSYHIDRINPNKGYTIDNIQILTSSDNTKKNLVFRYHWNDEEKRMEYFTGVEKEIQFDGKDVPF